MALALVDKVGISEVEKQHLWRGALLHDIGKMGVPNSILLKPGPLSEAEKQIIEAASYICISNAFPIHLLSLRWKYPTAITKDGTVTAIPVVSRGEDIPLSARLFAIVDVFECTHIRPPLS